MISIIVPIHNVEQYLESCLNSIVNQTYKDLEIILVNDASSDRSGLICDEYAKTDDRIIVKHFDNNIGVSEARNYGIDISRGEYLAFVDSDDSIDLNMFDSLFKAIKKYKCDIVSSSYYRIFPNGYKEYVGIGKKEIEIMDRYQSLEYVLYGNGIASLWGKLFKKNIIGNDRMINIFGEDLEFITRIYAKINKTCALNNPYYNWFYRNVSLTNSHLNIGWLNRLKTYDVSISYLSDNYPNIAKKLSILSIDIYLDHLYMSRDIQNGKSERETARSIIIKKAKMDFLGIKNVSTYFKLFALFIGLDFFDFCHKLIDIAKNK